MFSITNLTNSPYNVVLNDLSKVICGPGETLTGVDICQDHIEFYRKCRFFDVVESDDIPRKRGRPRKDLVDG